MTFFAVSETQERAKAWCVSRFGESAMCRQERATRVLEESIELAQSEGVPPEQARLLLEHVYSRPVGEPRQEAGGIMVCLLIWAAAADMNLWSLAITELRKIESCSVEYFRRRVQKKIDAGLAKPMENLDD